MLVERAAVRAGLGDGLQQRLVELASDVGELVAADDRTGRRGFGRQQHVDLREKLVRHSLEAEAAIDDRIFSAWRAGHRMREREEDLVGPVRAAGAAGVGDVVWI